MASVTARSLFRALVVLVAPLTLSCMFGNLHTNLDALEEHARVSGEVTAQDWNESPIVVGVLHLAEVDGAPDRPYDKYEMHGPGEYYFILPPGRYRVVAYEDTNRNFVWDEAEGERLASYNGFSPIELQVGEQRGRVDVHITDRAPRNIPEVSDEELQRRDSSRSGVVALSDARFGPETGVEGLWRPVEFLDSPGWGLFLLQEYEADKVPVVFVHGISGYPQEFTRLIEGLDRTRFQPWVLQYPSGFDLVVVADALDQVLAELRHAHGFERTCLVAHSMGGVLARLFLKRHVRGEASRVHTYVSIVSPLGGMASAGMGASSAPIVVPSWRNLDPTGDTIPHLYDTPLPEGLRYHLFFAHQDGTSDTVVELSSQLRPEAMEEAAVMHGFHDTHTGVLRAPRTSRLLNESLDACGEPTSGLTTEPAEDEPAVDSPRVNPAFHDHSWRPNDVSEI